MPGHQSVLVRLPRTGPVLLAIDAINVAAQADPDNGPPGPFDEDAAGVRASVRKLRDVAAGARVALTVYGHDSAQWRALRCPTTTTERAACAHNPTILCRSSE